MGKSRWDTASPLAVWPRGVLRCALPAVPVHDLAEGTAVGPDERL